MPIPKTRKMRQDIRFAEMLNEMQIFNWHRIFGARMRRLEQNIAAIMLLW
jgi:hypothetical protein